MDLMACKAPRDSMFSSGLRSFSLSSNACLQNFHSSRTMQQFERFFFNNSRLSTTRRNLPATGSRSSSWLIACRGSSQPPKFSSFSNSIPDTEKPGNEGLSAKERRKLRNERREEQKAAQEKPWKEMVENKWLTKPKKAKGWEADADVNQLISKGMQWWMIQTTRKYENQVAEQLEIVFAETFPDREFEVLLPTLPTLTKLKDGSVSDARRKIFQGIVLLRCVLDRDVYDLVRRIPRAYDFFGNKAGVSYQPMIMPAPVAHLNMENLFRQIREEEEAFEKFKEQCKIEVEEERKKAEEKEILEAQALQLEVGATIRVLSGPFTEFTGVVTELLPEVNKVKALVTVFGKDTPIILDVDQIVVQAAAAN